MKREALLPTAGDRRRIVGGAFAGTLAARHCYREVRVFWLEEEKAAKSAVDAEDLLSMSRQGVLFMGQTVRPGAVGLLTGMEYSRVGSGTWI